MIAGAGLVVEILKYFGVIVDHNSIVTILSSIAIIYGWIHQFVVTKKVVKMAKAQGVMGLK